jgi:hypothetical protein
MSIQDNYISAFRQAQEAWTGAVASLTEDVQGLTKSATPTGTIDPSAAIDQVFDFWSSTLESQRQLLKQIAGVSVTAGERVKEGVQQAESAAREQSEAAKDEARKQAQAAKRAERQRVVAKYEDMNKTELQDELSARSLTKSGTVDELRDRLVAEDLK